jgi:glycosyltransferase involved in cell wall biosynthesis
MTGSESPVRVAVVGPHYPYRGGIAHFTDRVCREMENDGIDVVRVSFSRLYPEMLFPGETQFEPGTPDDWARDWTDDGGGVSSNRLLIDSINPVSWLAAEQRLRSLAVDAVVFMYWMPFFAPAYATIARGLQKASIRTLAIVHNALPHERHVADEMLSDTFFSRCDAVCALSESVARDMRNMGSGLSADVIPHPVYDHFGDKIEKAAARKKIKIDPDIPAMLFFGLVRSYKGLGVLLDALAECRANLPDIRLIVAGEFYDDRQLYENQIQTLNLSKSVLMMDRYIESDLVPALFCAADVVVQPYLSATQSGVVQIAIQFERPCIVTDVGGLAESIGEAGAGLVVQAGDPVELARAIEHFFTEGVDERLTDGAVRLKAASSWGGYVSFIKREINRN